MTIEYPKIRAAAIHIFYDNGMVHRHTTEAELMQQTKEELERKYTPAQMAEVEADLARLTADELETICTDNHHCAPVVSDLTDEMLDYIFEGEA